MTPYNKPRFSFCNIIAGQKGLKLTAKMIRDALNSTK